MISPTPSITITVYGNAKPAGSKRGFVVNGRAVLTDANKNSRDWKNAVASAAREAYQGELLTGPLSVGMTFYVPRPMGHFRAKGGLKPSANLFPTKRPDLLKLARGVEDSLTGVVYRDDSQIVTEFLTKRWDEPARVEITIREEACVPVFVPK